MSASVANTQTTPEALTAAELNQYWDLREGRLLVEREARTNQKAENLLKDRIERWLTAATRDLSSRIVKLFGYELALEETSGRVDFEAEYIKLAGVEAAAALKRQAPKKLRLSVRKL